MTQALSGENPDLYLKKLHLVFQKAPTANASSYWQQRSTKPFTGSNPVFYGALFFPKGVIIHVKSFKKCSKYDLY